MATISEKTPLIAKACVQDKLYQEDGERYQTTIPPRGTSSYLDRASSQTSGLLVRVKHDTTHLENYVPKRDFQGKFTTFKDRDALLDHEVGQRMEERVSLPDSKRYVGFKLSFGQKIARFFGWNIDSQLQDDPTTPLKVNYSAKNVYNMKIDITPSKAIRDKLSLQDHETYKLGTKVTWCFNSSLNGYQYVDESGKTVKIHNATTSSNDRSTSNICMMRRMDDTITNESLTYTGRPDTKSKAVEQIEFIFRSEMSKNKDVRKGITEKDGVYTLTYVVNNLMSPLTGIGLVAFDEKGAILSEQKILQELSGKELIIDGKKVKIQPLYFSQPFNQTTSLEAIITDSHSGKKVAQSINKAGYKMLLPLAKQSIHAMDKSDPKKEILQAAVDTLEFNSNALLPEEELFNRALICQMVGIPFVEHCKSSTDRTVLAYAIAAIAHQWNKLDLDFIRDDKGTIVPHLILKNEEAKELFAGHCLGGHQVTRVSRTCEGVVKGQKIGTRILGFEWSSNPVAGRMLPERYTKINDVGFFKKGLVGFASTLGFIINLALSIPVYLIGAITQKDPFFNPIFIKPGISPFADRLIDQDSLYVGKGVGRSLLKPNDMISL